MCKQVTYKGLSIPLPPHKSVVFTNQKNARLLNEMYKISTECIVYSVYYEHFKKIKFNSTKLRWKNFTQNAYQDLVNGHWCKLFGSDKEPTHYTKLVDYTDLDLSCLGFSPVNKETLKNEVLRLAKINKEKFNEYRENSKKYRDKNLVHREHSPEKINPSDIFYPKIEIAIKTVFGFYQILRSLLLTLPEHQNSTNDASVMFDNIDNFKSMQTMIENEIPLFNNR